ncbi:EXTL2, alpha-1,4-N-acetylhexosaminyltransferase [Dictyocaulus viviparus]|uniref:EXTL2, alpha-1,4-N-acetylhexosaminyltransferase n=1 Tax=Dictyocaulus viviparus TaxID=29172 RepID=A0A0D8Y087_DICVI|nr:EXTL2, alpha-1,4-N-acetylhexosaminyltransferase [Dictyocaulus viviparus]
MLIVTSDESEGIVPFLSIDVSRLNISALYTDDRVQILNCSGQFNAYCCSQQETFMRDSSFCVIFNSKNFPRLFWESLRLGCIPVVASMDVILPFQANLDWRLASVRIALARFPELHFILRSFDMPEVLEMRRMGRIFFEHYLSDRSVVIRTLLASLRERLGILSPAQDVVNVLISGKQCCALSPACVLGPIEASVDSPAFLHNFSSINMYSYRYWNIVGISGKSPEFIPFSVDPPSESEFFADSNIGFRPIKPGSGVEFSKALGGNRIREQFTVVLLTYNRDSVLSTSLERLHRLPYLNKVIVIWNNIAREPPGAWPRLHVPVEFIKVPKNSLNNRFVPWNRIRTEAVLSLDDDVDLEQQEIIFAFRVWRENRHRIVGFPARYHARYGDQMYYNSNYTCQLSIILTGAAFLHKSYLHAYTHQMPQAIRQHVDDVTNCEDIAMNFLVAHLTRQSPIKTTDKWTLKCPTCSESLWRDQSHFRERNDCIHLFTKIYGYNPLKFTQYRADSVLFKTDLPPDRQKCFRSI